MREDLLAHLIRFSDHLLKVQNCTSACIFKYNRDAIRSYISQARQNLNYATTQEAIDQSIYDYYHAKLLYRSLIKLAVKNLRRKRQWTSLSQN